MIVVDWVLLLTLIVLTGFWINLVITAKDLDYQLYQLTAFLLFIITGLLLPHAIIIGSFNPATDDCTEWEACPIFQGEHGRAFNITPNEIGCIYLNQGVVLRQVQVENLNKLLKGGEAKDCVSWQPKPCKSDETPKEVWNSVYATYNCTDVIGLTLATSNINAKHSYIPYPEVQSNCVLDNLSFGGKETICVKKQPSEAVPKNEVKI